MKEGGTIYYSLACKLLPNIRNNVLESIFAGEVLKEELCSHSKAVVRLAADDDYHSSGDKDYEPKTIS